MANINTYGNTHLMKDRFAHGLARSPEKIGYEALHIIFVLAPIIAGADKFFNVLTNWSKYVAPGFPQIIGVSAETLIRAGGVVEIIAGIGIALKPRIFAFVVSAWLLAIVVNLLILGNYYDVALRDLGLAVSVFALGMMSRSNNIYE